MIQLQVAYAAAHDRRQTSLFYGIASNGLADRKGGVSLSDEVEGSGEAVEPSREEDYVAVIRSNEVRRLLRMAEYGQVG